VAEFDAVSELTHNREAYSTPHGTSTKPSTIYGFPPFLYTVMDRIRAKVEDGPRPGLNPTICCCITYALRVLASNPEVQAVLSLHDQFRNAPVTTLCREHEELAGMLRSFDISIPDLAGMKPRRQNVTLPEPIKNALSGLAGELGTSFSSLCIISIVIALHAQPQTFPQRRAEMKRIVEEFFERVATRRGMYQDLLDGIEKKSASREDAR
jgi:hypothetical protein